MLVELVVENYAVVERIRVRFHRGLNLLTGETGSGKSIVVDSLGLLFGGRASAGVVRSGATQARITGIFEAPANPEFRAVLESYGVEIEDGELIIEREIQANGKSRAFLGSRPVAAAVLRDLAQHLGDIHGQHDQQMLFAPAHQLEILDAFAGCEPVRQQVTQAFQAWSALRRELASVDQGEQEKLRMADLWMFQKREIEDAALRPGEDSSLEAERRILLNSTRLQEGAEAAYASLYDSEGAALGQIRAARKRIDDLRRFDDALGEILETLKPAEIAVEEASHSLRHYLGGLEADPGRLEKIESRLAAIDRLKRKYGASADEILAFHAGVAAKLSAIENTAERRARLERDLAVAAASYEKEAGRLTQAREKAAADLEKAVRKELGALAMGGTVFQCEFGTGEWSANGRDRVRFLFSANAGEEPRPLEKIASGGELSRLALGLKTCAMPESSAILRTLVFDEVDTGIGGATAESVGRRLKKLASRNQLLCVTHLAQVAGFASHHYRVEKRESGGRTVTSVTELDAAERTQEIARMLSGQKLTPEAIRHAEQLIKMASAP
ncbi:MAG: DNA repair protein RecN [Acidobacteria bacterium]|nr:DNA repair protein RecN [Acidobacteriota bacterium]